ncbi:MAG: AAA family ATPase [Planctomycetes bacterium]|nr:AAA family ATPase [Planctomycetota bacterium]
MDDGRALAAQVTGFAARVATLRERIGRVVIGQDALVGELVIGVLAGGHVLIEGLPGLGKTKLAHALAAGLGLRFSRIQFTPDLMPADVTGTRIVEQDERGLGFRFQPGPLFANFVLADEINRATPKTQSALLEAMQEGSVTVGERTHPLPRPFCVVATQNPIELEGTFPLPEAQLDRFLFKLTVDRPSVVAATTGAAEANVEPVFSADELVELQATSRRILCGEHLLRFVAELIRATDPQDPEAGDATRSNLRFGASPRAAQSIVLGAKVRALLDARPVVERGDVEACALAALRHRVHWTFEATAEERRVEDLLPGWVEAARKRAR